MKLLPEVTYLLIIQEAVIPFKQICWGLSVSETGKGAQAQKFSVLS